MTQQVVTVDEAFGAAASSFQAGDLEKAAYLCNEILTVAPQHADSLHLMGFISWQLGRAPDAIEFMRRAAAARPNDAELLSNLGIFYKETGQSSPAIECFLEAVKVNKEYFVAYHNLGVTLTEANRLKEAIECYEYAIHLKGDVPAFHNGLALAYNAQGRLDKARESLKIAVALDPEAPESGNNLGVIEQSLGDMISAIGTFHRVLEKHPGHFESLKNLADTYATLSQHEKAAETYQKALEVDPSSYESALGIAVSRVQKGDTREAAAAFTRAQEIRPKSLAPLWGSTMGMLPSSFSTAEEIETVRERYRSSLDELNDCIKTGEEDPPPDVSAVGSLQPFYLACQGRDDRELQSQYGSMVCKIMAAGYPQWSKPLPPPEPAEGRRIKVGFASRYFHNHANWKILLGGWVEGLDRRQFQLRGYRTGGITDDITVAARDSFDVFVEGLDFEQLCARIRADNLDVLIFPETGMDPVTLRLAALRLAPVQCVSWGHPDTSGLPTIDYFLSSDLMEPENGQDYYTEKLVRLPNLSTFYIPPKFSADASKIEQYGIRDDAVRYLCAQTLHKYLPQHDAIYPRIAAKVPNAQFIFIVHPPSAEAKFKERLKQAFSEAGLDYLNHVTFLPMLSNEEFLGLCSRCDVFLDSLEWSGCTTTLEALEQNLVPVTLPGKFMRGRHTSAILTMMDITDTIAKNTDEYVDYAVRLGLDKDWRRQLAEQIEERRYLLYRDPEAIVALEDFLKSCCP